MSEPTLFGIPIVVVDELPGAPTDIYFASIKPVVTIKDGVARYDAIIGGAVRLSELTTRDDESESTPL